MKVMIINITTQNFLTAFRFHALLIGTWMRFGFGSLQSYPSLYCIHSLLVSSWVSCNDVSPLRGNAAMLIHWRMHELSISSGIKLLKHQWTLSISLIRLCYESFCSTWSIKLKSPPPPNFVCTHKNNGNSCGSAAWTEGFCDGGNRNRWSMGPRQ